MNIVIRVISLANDKVGGKQSYRLVIKLNAKKASLCIVVLQSDRNVVAV